MHQGTDKGNWLGRLFCCLLLLSGQEGAAQLNTGYFNTGEPFRQRVLTVESFINRFNHEEDGEGNYTGYQEVSPDSTGWVQERNGSIRALFNESLLRDPEGRNRQLVERFLTDVNAPSRPLKLNFYDREWYAEVQLDVLYKRQPQQLTLLLQVEETEPEVARWAVRGVKADFLEMAPKKPDSSRLIPPNSHGNDFVGVPENLSDPAAIAHFTAREVKPDVLSIFLYSVYNRELVLKKTTRVTFHFLQLDGWIVRVAESTGDGRNSGWLVDELIPADLAAKRLYAAQHLNLR